MTYCRSTLILALSVIVAAETASGERSLPDQHIATGKMNEVFTNQLVVKVNGANLGSGKRAFLTNEQVNRLSKRLGGATFKGGLMHGGWTMWEIPAGMNARTAWQLLKQERDVICAEPVNRVYPVSLPVPNDPDWSYIETSSTFVLGGGPGSGSGSGSGSSGVSGFRRLWNLWDINAVTDDSGGVVSGGWAVYPGTWYTSATKPNDCPIIAFVDTGLDMAHPDFINAGGTGTDVTKGGQLMTAQSGYFHNGVKVPGGDPNDLNGHGTHVAGIAIAAGNNGAFNNDGVIGVGYNSRGMILRVFDSAGNASDVDAAAAIVYAADTGAAIINCSLGTTNYSQLFQDAVTYATQKGSLVVCAGNESGSGGGNLGPIYPAACSGALAVTANAPGLYQANDYYAGYGNYVGIAAPGGDLVIKSTTNQLLQYVFSTSTRYPCELSQNPAVKPSYTLNYTYLVGTSMACPHVSGAAGLFYGKNGMHQTDGFANLKAFQALQASSMGTAGAPNGGWEPTQGFGSLDVEALMNFSSNTNPRGATVGAVTGIVYFGGNPTSNTRVTATQTTAPFTTYTTTTFGDGTYRFDSFPTGVYDIKATPFGASKTKRVQVSTGCDMPGVDFFAGPAITDLTPPKIGKFNFIGGNSSAMSFDQWAYDTETEIDSATVQIGSTPNSANIMASQLILPGTTRVNLTGLKLPPHYFVTFAYTNGVGGVSRGVRASQANTQDAFVADSAPKKDYLLSHLDVKNGGAGFTDVAFISLDISNLGSTIGDARLTLKGNSVGSPVNVGIFATNNPKWTETGLNLNNAPSILGNAVDEQSVGSFNSYTWNITSIVRAAKAAGASSVTMAVKCDSASNSGASFGSRRSKSSAPLVTFTAND